MKNANYTGFVLSWYPDFAELSNEADLGNTFGIYSLILNFPDTVLKGTYVFIWKKQSGGKWKFALDTGNEGLEKKLSFEELNFTRFFACGIKGF